MPCHLAALGHNKAACASDCLKGLAFADSVLAYTRCSEHVGEIALDRNLFSDGRRPRAGQRSPWLSSGRFSQFHGHA